MTESQQAAKKGQGPSNHWVALTEKVEKVCLAEKVAKRKSFSSSESFVNQSMY